MANLFTPTDVFGEGQKQYVDSLKNLQSIGQARRKLEKEREDLDFQKKQRKFELGKMKREGALGELDYQARLELDKKYAKQQQQILDGKSSEVSMVEQQTRQKADQSIQAQRQAYMADPQGVTQYVMNQRAKRILSPSFKGDKFSYEFIDPEEEYLNREKLRLDVQKKHMDAQKREYSKKDVVDLAKKLSDGNDVQAYMGQAESILSGKETPQRQKFKNNSTGEIEEFEKVDGKWQKVQQ